MSQLTTSSVYIRTGIYLVDITEYELYLKWLSLPHPEIHTAATRTTFQVRPVTPELEAEVAATITVEQNKRFALFVRVNVSTGTFVLTWQGGIHGH